MLTAVKGNRETKITEDQKEEFLRAGYDVIDKNGVRTIAPSKTVPYAEVIELGKVNKALSNEMEQAKASMTELTTAYDEAIKKVSDLIKDNEKLKKELDKAKKGE